MAEFGTPAFTEKLHEMQRLLIEAYEHYFAYESHCKSYEGTITVEFPNIFDLRNGKTEPTITVSSYVFAEGRYESFANIDDALAAVTEWHAIEMSFIPEPSEDE